MKRKSIDLYKPYPKRPIFNQYRNVVLAIQNLKVQLDFCKPSVTGSSGAVAEMNIFCFVDSMMDYFVDKMQDAYGKRK